MKNCIIFTTKHGSAAKAADLLKQKLNAETDIINLNDVKKIDITDYDTIVLGGSIYIGKIQKRMIKFIKKNLKQLLNKNITLYVMAGEKDNPEAVIQKVYLPELNDHAISKRYFGYEMILENMNALEKAVVKSLGVKESVSELNHEAIEDMAKTINDL